MIKANELRIGNWVICDGYFKVNHILTRTVESYRYVRKYEELQPIPLTLKDEVV